MRGNWTDCREINAGPYLRELTSSPAFSVRNQNPVKGERHVSFLSRESRAAS
jgi:hypothetical protein